MDEYHEAYPTVCLEPLRLKHFCLPSRTSANKTMRLSHTAPTYWHALRTEARQHLDLAAGLHNQALPARGCDFVYDCRLPWQIETDSTSAPPPTQDHSLCLYKPD